MMSLIELERFTACEQWFGNDNWFNRYVIDCRLSSSWIYFDMFICLAMRRHMFYADFPVSFVSLFCVCVYSMPQLLLFQFSHFWLMICQCVMVLFPCLFVSFCCTLHFGIQIRGQPARIHSFPLFWPWTKLVVTSCSWKTQSPKCALEKTDGVFLSKQNVVHVVHPLFWNPGFGELQWFIEFTVEKRMSQCVTESWQIYKNWKRTWSTSSPLRINFDVDIHDIECRNLQVVVYATS